MSTRSLNLVKISRRINDINNITDTAERIKSCRNLFIDVLMNEELYVIATPETTKEQWDNNMIRPYIDQAGQGEKYYLRIYSDKSLATAAAKRIDSVLEDGTVMIIKVSKEQLISLVQDYFILGVDGVLLNDGADWITLNLELFLYIGYCDVLNIPDHYDPDFVNSVTAIYDIARNRVRIVAPYKAYDGITEEDILSGKAELYNYDNEILLIEYYDKYKVDELFEEKVYWSDLTIDKFVKFLEMAKDKGLDNIRIAYKNKQGNGTPDNLLELINAIGIERLR